MTTKKTTNTLPAIILVLLGLVGALALKQNSKPVRNEPELIGSDTAKDANIQLDDFVNARFALKNEVSPQFSLVNLDGARKTLANFSDKPLIINFFASWCSECKAELTDFVKYYEDEGSGKINFVAINYAEDANIAREFAIAYGLPRLTDVLLDSDGKVFNNFRATIPSTFFIKDGRVRAFYPGALSPEALALSVDKLLEAK